MFDFEFPISRTGLSNECNIFYFIWNHASQNILVRYFFLLGQAKKKIFSKKIRIKKIHVLENKSNKLRIMQNINGSKVFNQSYWTLSGEPWFDFVWLVFLLQSYPPLTKKKERKIRSLHIDFLVFLSFYFWVFLFRHPLGDWNGWEHEVRERLLPCRWSRGQGCYGESSQSGKS